MNGISLCKHLLCLLITKFTFFFPNESRQLARHFRDGRDIRRLLFSCNYSVFDVYIHFDSLLDWSFTSCSPFRFRQKSAGMWVTGQSHEIESSNHFRGARTGEGQRQEENALLISTFLVVVGFYSALCVTIGVMSSSPSWFSRDCLLFIIVLNAVDKYL